MGEDNETIAIAEAKDYEEIIPAEKPCKYYVLCHVTGGLIIGGIVVGLVTLGILFFS